MKTLTAILLLSFLSACGGGGNESPVDDTSNPTVAQVVAATAAGRNTQPVNCSANPAACQ